MTLKSSLATTLAFLFPLIGVPSAQAQYNWVPYEDNPVMDFNFDPTSALMFRPAVLKKDGVFHMWYGKEDLTSTSGSVGYATSADGVEWTLKNLFAVEPSGNLGAFDEIVATNASVVEDGDTLRMWYNGFRRIGELRAIGYAWSIDGVNWTKVKGSGAGGSVFDVSMDGTPLWGVVVPTVVKLDGVFHMWYMKLVTADGKSRIGYARSTNGLNWTVVPGSGTAQSVVDVGDPATFDANQVWWPWVLYNDVEAIFEMWYQGIDDPQFGGVPRLGCARSNDGITWEKVPGEGDAGACRNTLAQPGVLLDDGVYRMWYTFTTDVSPNNDIVLYATSDPTATATQEEEVPNQFTIVSAYPNPFRSEVTVEFALKKSGSVRLEIHDVLGRLVHIQEFEGLAPGSHSVVWNGRRFDGVVVPSGTYLIRLVENGQTLIGLQTVQLNR